MNDETQNLETTLRKVEELEVKVNTLSQAIKDQIANEAKDLKDKVNSNQKSSEAHKLSIEHLGSKIIALESGEKPEWFRIIVSLVVFCCLIGAQAFLLSIVNDWNTTYKDLVKKEDNSLGETLKKAKPDKVLFIPLSVDTTKAGTVILNTNDLPGKRSAWKHFPGMALIVFGLAFLICFLATIWLLYQYAIVWPKARPLNFSGVKKELLNQVSNKVSEKLSMMEGKIKAVEEKSATLDTGFKELKKPIAEQQLQQLLEVIKVTRTKTETGEGKDKETKDEVNAAILNSLSTAISNLFKDDPKNGS